MAQALYFVNKSTGKKFLVVSLDKEKQIITLKGEHSTFQETYDKERFIRLGYVLEKEEVPDQPKA